MEKTAELVQEVQAAVRELAEAQRALDMAAPGYVDAAVLRLSAARERCSALLREAKQGGVKVESLPWDPGR